MVGVEGRRSCRDDSARIFSLLNVESLQHLTLIEGYLQVGLHIIGIE